MVLVVSSWSITYACWKGASHLLLDGAVVRLRRSPGPSVAPDQNVVVGGLPGRQIMRQIMQHSALLVAAKHDIEHGVDDLAPDMERRASTCLYGRHKRFQEHPFTLMQIAGIGLPGRWYGWSPTSSLA